MYFSGIRYAYAILKIWKFTILKIAFFPFRCVMFKNILIFYLFLEMNAFPLMKY